MTTTEAVAEIVEVVAGDAATSFPDIEQARSEVAALWREQVRVAAPKSVVGESLLAVIGRLESSGLVEGRVDRSALPWPPPTST